MSGTIKSVYLKVSPFEFISILEYKDIKMVNEHGIAQISGYIDSEKEQEYLEIASKDSLWVNIDVFDEKNDNLKTIFTGVLTSLQIKSKNKLKILTLEIKTATQLMDTTTHIRMYQEPSIQYKNIIKSILDKYPNGNHISTVEHNRNIQNLILQYKETDWEFLKRLASHFETVLIPDVETYGSKFYFGVPKFTDEFVINTNEYKMCKSSERYDLKKGGGVSIKQYDEIEYIFDSRNLYRVGEKIIFNNMELYVYKIETRFNKDELVHTYYLKTRNGFKVPKCFNNDINGLSLMGNVTSISKTYVTVKIDLDENKENGGKRWFLYSTVYSSSDGTGWYCMPEVNDRIRLHFPNRDESNAYVISSYHLESLDSSERKNPDYKSIMNKYKKEILLTPNSLILTNNSGMSIEINDSTGISIKSNKNVYVNASNTINVKSSNDRIKIISPQNVTLQQGKNTMVLKDNITVKGDQTKIE